MTESVALSVAISIRAGRGNDAFSVEASLSLEKGVLVLFGPSGTGKTLTLRAIAGLVRPTRGRVALHDETLFEALDNVDVPAHLRRIGYVPQESALFPFLDVRENVAFALSHSEKDGEAVRALLDELGIAKLANRRVGQLSGGEKQRVAFARALASKPRLLLLDEPFAAVDLEGRRDLLSAMRRAVDARAIPTVLVTHDAKDAMEIADTVTRFERSETGIGRTGASGPPGEVLGATA